jgi:hypothetical protein
MTSLNAELKLPVIVSSLVAPLICSLHIVKERVATSKRNTCAHIRPELSRSDDSYCNEIETRIGVTVNTDRVGKLKGCSNSGFGSGEGEIKRSHWEVD